jgi:hypothetical protein
LSNKILFLELCAGLLLISLGFYVWYWSSQLIWIQIYPPPIAKTLIETLPFVFWIAGVLLFIDVFRKYFKKNHNLSTYHH